MSTNALHVPPVDVPRATAPTLDHERLEVYHHALQCTSRPRASGHSASSASNASATAYASSRSASFAPAASITVSQAISRVFARLGEKKNRNRARIKFLVAQLGIMFCLANLALDLIGQATLLLGEAGDGDKLAFHRDVLDFRNCLLVEQPNGDFAQTIARHLLYTTWQHMLLQRLQQSSDRFLVEFAHKAVKEVAYHRDHALQWTLRLGDGTE